jgi:hypothetical protein
MKKNLSQYGSNVVDGHSGESENPVGPPAFGLFD